jgi:hypothetical protein
MFNIFEIRCEGVWVIRFVEGYGCKDSRTGVKRKATA